MKRKKTGPDTQIRAVVIEKMQHKPQQSIGEEHTKHRALCTSEKRASNVSPEASAAHAGGVGKQVCEQGIAPTTSRGNAI
jgi:hypothetical protein